MTNTAAERLLLATTVRQARDALGEGRVALAGGTWLMRAAIRGEELPRRFVSLGGIAALRQIEPEDDWLAIGGAVTHAKLDRALQHYPQLRALHVAATLSANPAIRRVATVGGNLCSVAFAASDLAPALLALDAEARLETQDGPVTLSMAEFLARRGELLTRSLLTMLRVPLSTAHSAHQRLPLRKAGDYPAAIVSMAIIGERLAIAVGSVEPVARRWSTLEAALQGGLPLPEIAAEVAAAANDFKGRDGPEADGWYRREVLPALVRRGVVELWRVSRTMSIAFELNGEACRFEGDPITALLDVLRRRQFLTGTKSVCREGFCGACMVHVDGEPVVSCLLPIGLLEGRAVVTIEGASISDRNVRLLQQAFERLDAVQCGMCFPGMAMSLSTFIAESPSADRQAVKRAMVGNICRCTGYERIVDAVMECLAADEGKGDAGD